MTTKGIITRIRASDINPEVWPPARWLLARPRLIDALVIASSTVPQLVALSFSGGEQPLSAWITVILVGVALWWRRDHAFWVIIALAVISCIHPTMYLTVAFAFTGYSLASTGPIARTITGVASAFLAAAAGLGVRWLITADGTFSNPVFDAFVLIAVALGLATRGRKDRRAAVDELIAQRIENARQLERTRIAAEMHDVVAHSLSVMIALADGAAASRERDPEQSARAIDHLAATSRSALIEMQTAIGVLRTSDVKLDDALDSSGYNVPELEKLVEVFRAVHLPVVLIREGNAVDFSPNLRTGIYRIAQEALTNALRYASDATRVELRLSVSGDTTRLRVVDDGRSESTFAHGSGQGIVGIAERARLLGGSSEAGPLLQGGWLVDASIPLRQDVR
ncbi:sensor histidine kinase [Zhihengliuella halotolerans]|uniref:sensor histidine kinase n=1 Tax=Zhihengliuella halotolerans TaxID=370736 RepID=UPI00102D022A|nr:histidine kinase [Zhihengliuella halotolerans]